MYFHFYPRIFDWLFPNRVWRKRGKGKKIYLTFDDGPTEEMTSWLLELLKSENVKATFFCVGENLLRFPSLTDRMREEGHQLANHTMNHKVCGENESYAECLRRIEDCEQLIGSSSKKLFRPPHGKLSRSFAIRLSKHYKIVMWSILSGDFDEKRSKEEVLNNTLKNLHDGAIMVFHDNLRCSEKLRWVLPKFLSEAKSRGFHFELL